MRVIQAQAGNYSANNGFYGYTTPPCDHQGPMKHLPAPLYESLPAGYAWAAWAAHQHLATPWGWVPASMFAGAALVSTLGRVVYRHRMRQPFYATQQRRGS